MTAAKKISDPITLAEPIVRGDQKISEIALRKPNAGELRGISLIEIGQLKVDALLTLIPRIAVPPLTEAEVANLPADDIGNLGGIIFSFFMNTNDRAQMEAMLKT